MPVGTDDGASVGASVGMKVGYGDGIDDGASDGTSVGANVGKSVGSAVGTKVGNGVGSAVGPAGCRVGQHALRFCDNAALGAALPSERWLADEVGRPGKATDGRMALAPTEPSAHQGNHRAAKIKLQRLDIPTPLGSKP